MCKSARNSLIIMILVLSAANVSISQTMVTLLSESYDNNRNQWDEINNFSYLSKVMRGSYYVRNRHNGNYFITDKEVKFKADSNFVIEAIIKKKAGVKLDGFGISWGRKNGHNAYSFTISSGGTFDIGKWEKDQWIYLQSKTSDAINKGKKENKLAIHKVGNQYEFYINEVLVDRKPYKPLEGTKVGFIIYNSISISVKELKVKGTPTVPLGSTISSAKIVRKDSIEIISNESPQEKARRLNKKTQIKKQEPEQEASKVQNPKTITVGVTKPKNLQMNFMSPTDMEIIVTKVDVFDKSGDYGDSYILGNNNRLLEPGEAVRLSVQIMNNSKLIRNGSISVQSLSNEYILTNTTNLFLVRDLKQSDLMKIDFDLFLSKSFHGDKIRLNLNYQNGSNIIIPLTVYVH